MSSCGQCPPSPFGQNLLKETALLGSFIGRRQLTKFLLSDSAMAEGTTLRSSNCVVYIYMCTKFTSRHMAMSICTQVTCACRSEATPLPPPILSIMWGANKKIRCNCRQVPILVFKYSFPKQLEQW